MNVNMTVYALITTSYLEVPWTAEIVTKLGAIYTIGGMEKTCTISNIFNSFYVNETQTRLTVNLV